MASFLTLWQNHPVIKGTTPLLDRGVYANQCAVNMYASMKDSGVNVGSFHGQLSWQKNAPKYAIRAQELANWMENKNSVFSAPQKFHGEQIKGIFKKIDGKT
jgi:hypothetical protein